MRRLSLPLLCLSSALIVWRPGPTAGESSVFLPAPQNITIESRNFVNVLRWSPVKGVNGTVSYHVEQRVVSSEHWEEVNCTNISKPECNFDHGMEVSRNLLRVRAEQGGLKSNWSQVGPFQAKTDTILGPPWEINVTSEANTLTLSFRSPLEHTKYDSDLVYIIHQWDESLSGNISSETKNTAKKFKNLKEATQYCFQVQAMFENIKGEISGPHCNKTTTTERTRNIYIAAIFGVLMFTILATFLCLCVIRKYKSTIKYFWQPRLRIPSHYEEDLQNAQVVAEYTFWNCAEEHWDIVSVISNTSQNQTLRDSFASGNQVDVSNLNEHR
nr:PREDICTED: interferon gamma receptor 2 [Anolis carolinensis]|eukprot:XP_008105773.1 PREDICTED: interferon gamma receptor 2 [Anolis carolinensis]